MNVDGFFRISRLCLLFALPFLSLACGGSDKVRVYPVHGEVYYNGQPATGAVIVLHPRDKEKCRPAYATVQADGTFKMSTYGKFDGAAAGDYVITVSWSDERQEEGETIFSPDKLGERYSRADNSDLKATVKSGKNELPRYDLN